MTSRKPSPGELEPIETASRDELVALQLSRLKWTLAHAYDNVAHYRKSFDKAGVHPDDLKSLADLQKWNDISIRKIRSQHQPNRAQQTEK